MRHFPFVNDSDRINEILSMCEVWNKSPSDIMKCENTYISWCIDEAVLLFYSYIKDGLKPMSINNRGKYKRLSEFYEDLELN